MRTCTACGETKDLTEFNKSKNNAGGRTPRCKVCLNRLKREKYYTPADRRRYWVKHAYGIKEEDLGPRVCAICKTTEGEFHVDHCHSTGVVRGLLCRKCNLGLGHFRDSTDFLAAAIEYLNTRRM